MKADEICRNSNSNIMFAKFNIQLIGCVDVDLGLHLDLHLSLQDKSFSMCLATLLFFKSMAKIKITTRERLHFVWLCVVVWAGC